MGKTSLKLKPLNGRTNLAARIIDNITYRMAGPDDSHDWDRYVDNHPQRTFSHRWHWSSVLKKSFLIEPIYCLALDNDKIVGVLPTALMKSMLFGKYLISLPWLDYGGIAIK